ncbi:hypothetical protein Scep_029560 [Stephania cephalantha]|uniref:Uncharacterized protein n=1 Tax=Stephania cephalantha TaxID=152367 RepID=A0AAP0DXW7_9MAGN
MQTRTVIRRFSPSQCAEEIAEATERAAAGPSSGGGRSRSDRPAARGSRSGRITPHRGAAVAVGSKKGAAANNARGGEDRAAAAVPEENKAQRQRRLAVDRTGARDDSRSRMND